MSQEKFEVFHGDNMPVQAPFYKSPNNPQYCKGLKTITVFCRTRPEVIRKYLEPTPFEYLTDQFMITFGDYSNNTAAVFYDASLVIPVKYKDVTGGYVLFEYEDLPSSVSGGRELWGYPKKEAEFQMERDGSRVAASVSREGHEIIHIELDLSAPPEAPLPEITPYPHLLLWTLPRYDGPGIQSQKILKRDTSMDFKLQESREAAASLTMHGYEHLPIMEPLHEWQPVQVYGARYAEGDYASTEENGWAELVDVIVPDQDSIRTRKEENHESII